MEIRSKTSGRGTKVGHASEAVTAGVANSWLQRDATIPRRIYYHRDL
jgi:hypothetical protein